jgi:type IX secretion system PorP/SprF family membrane protein
MNRIKIIYALLLSLIGTGVAFGQQQPRFSNYMFNDMLTNPAASGSTGQYTIRSGFRAQWTGIEGAPQTQYISVDGPFARKKIGLGLQIINDQAALIGQKELSVSGAYRLRTGDKSWLCAGGNLGFKQFTFDGTKAQGFIKEDNAIPITWATTTIPDMKAGIYYHSPNQYYGISVANLLGGKIDYTGNDREETGKLLRYYYITVGYTYDLDRDWKYQQMVLAKTDINSPVQIDLSGLIHYKKTFAAGLSYRFGESVVLLIQNQFSDKLKLAYAYDYTTTKLNTATSGSHELMMSYSIAINRRIMKNPRDF